jgi:uncharacterized membrane protein
VNEEERREEGRVLRERVEENSLDLLKHISTLNVAALILFLALIRDFGAEGSRPGVPTMVLVFFGVSLSLSVFGMLAYLLARNFVALLMVMFSISIFLAGFLIAVFVVGVQAL